jgi:hypothetical protein
VNQESRIKIAAFNAAVGGQPFNFNKNKDQGPKIPQKDAAVLTLDS